MAMILTWTMKPKCPHCGDEYDGDELEEVQDGDAPKIECGGCGKSTDVLCCVAKEFLVLSQEAYDALEAEFIEATSERDVTEEERIWLRSLAAKLGYKKSQSEPSSHSQPPKAGS